MKDAILHLTFLCCLLAGIQSTLTAQAPLKRPPKALDKKVNPHGDLVKPPIIKIDSGKLILPPAPPALEGFVDMHTHPASQLGFGEQLFHGANDGNPATALGSCNCIHNFVAPPFDGSCGQQNMYRNVMVDKLDRDFGINPVHNKTAGFPEFSQWPKHNSILHQQMWVDWIKRAKEGGLRVMVALAVNNHCIADGAETGYNNDDLRSMNRQIEHIKALVGRHSGFMQIAYTPEQLRRIVSQNKLAVILGVEMDNIGNFYNPADRKDGTYNPNPDEAAIKREIDRLFTLGVRYIFPIHITNNVFGGTALYNSGFNVANKYNTGTAFIPETVDASTGITFKLTSAFSAIRQDFLAGLAMGITGSILPGNIMPDEAANYPNYADPGLTKGHRNILGLSYKGQQAVRYMMRKGMIIDIDHCSEKAVTKALEIAEELDYPLNSGHNGFRGNGGGNENSRTDEQVRTIYRLGGMMGLGHGDGATNFQNNYRYGLRLTGNKALAIGTDVNGFYPLPGPPTAAERITYGPTLTQCTMGTKTWNFNDHGMAHYGLLPDYIASWTKAGMTESEKRSFFSSAERFATMWEKCNTVAARINSGGGTGSYVRSFTPVAIGALCPSQLVAGDREFGGHGPGITCRINLRIANGGQNVEAVINFTARETTADWSEVREHWVQTIYTAPGGMKVTSINSPSSFTTTFTSRPAGGEFGGCNDGQEHCSERGEITIPAGGLVRSICIIGDTGGEDISSDSDCRCDTRINRIAFNPVSVTLAAL